MTLLEMAAEYRRQIDVLKEHIRIVENMDPDKLGREGTLRLLNAMLRDTRDLAVWCEHYYDRSYYQSEKYRI